MRKLILLTLLVFAACSPCRNDDCPVDTLFFFQITDQNGVNLLQTPRQKYSADSISVLLKKDEIYTATAMRRNTSSIEVPLTANVSEIIIRYGSTEQDTLLMFNHAFSTLDDCCATFLQDYGLSGAALSCENCGSNTHTIVK